MEPNKFERHIKEQMQRREIRPSADAWKKVSERLEPTKEPKNNKFLWYAVAASFIGVLLISILFFQSDNKSLEGEGEIVGTEKQETINEQEENSKEQFNGKEHQDIIDKNISITTTEAAVTNTDSTEEPFVFQKRQSEIAVLKDDTIQKIEVLDLSKNKDRSIDLKIQEVLAQVDLLEQSKETLTDAEVDSLLYEAQRELLTEKMFGDNGSVDAMALLTEVEDELDQSFRDQIFEKLKTGFIKVRTAVADRNN